MEISIRLLHKTLPVVLFTPRTILQSPLCSAEFSEIDLVHG